MLYKRSSMSQWKESGLGSQRSWTQGLSHAEALAIAVDNYNQDSAEENVFRLLSAEPRPEWDADLGTPQVLNFTIQETVCPKAESPTPERCDFKADGVSVFPLPCRTQIASLLCASVTSSVKWGLRVWPPWERDRVQPH
uniref:Uncharacterized protein n=1 Tax=Ornithorhynchus anatinus TaxID=9258 RepID=A0A6I8NRQ9_ORNAN